MLVFQQRSIAQPVLERRFDARAIFRMYALQRILERGLGSWLERRNPHRLFRAHKLAAIDLDAEASDAGELLRFSEVRFAPLKRLIGLPQLLCSLRYQSLQVLMRLLQSLFRTAPNGDFIRQLLVLP